MTIGDLRKLLQSDSLKDTDAVSFFIKEDDIPQVVRSVYMNDDDGLGRDEFDKIAVMDSGNGYTLFEIGLSDRDKKYWEEN